MATLQFENYSNIIQFALDSVRKFPICTPLEISHLRKTSGHEIDTAEPLHNEVASNKKITLCSILLGLIILFFRCP